MNAVANLNSDLQNNPSEKQPSKKKSASAQEQFTLPMMDGPQTRPGRVMSGIATWPPIPGSNTILSVAPKAGTYFPHLSATSLAEYANERSQSILELIKARFQVGKDLIVVSAEGGDWLDVVRTAIHQAVADGYAALESGIPVAIPGDSEAIPEEVLSGK